jgi:hypothetical protein
VNSLRMRLKRVYRIFSSLNEHERSSSKKRPP